LALAFLRDSYLNSLIFEEGVDDGFNLDFISLTYRIIQREMIV